MKLRRSVQATSDFPPPREEADVRGAIRELVEEIARQLDLDDPDKTACDVLDAHKIDVVTPATAKQIIKELTIRERG